MLHTVNKSPASHAALKDCLAICSASDALLLLEDGVYGALTQASVAPELKRRHEAGLQIYAIDRDLKARGLHDMVAPYVKVIGYEQFVQLAVDHQATQSWF